MSLKSCFGIFLDDLDCSILFLLKNFLNLMITLVTAILLRKLLEATNLINSKLLYAKTILSLLEAIYGTILGTLDILGEYIKQYDYCTDVGDIMKGAKEILNDKAAPYLKAAREVRDYLLLDKLKEAEIEELENLKSKLTEMVDAVTSKISDKCS